MESYFLRFSIIVRSNLPIKDVLHKVDHSGGLSKWSMELIEYEIKYDLRKAIRANALADFVIELPCGAEGVECLNDPIWTLHVDGASSSEKQGVGLVLRGPKGMSVSKEVKLVSRLELAKKADLKSLRVYSNLLVQQINGEYDVQDSTLKKYE